MDCFSQPRNAFAQFSHLCQGENWKIRAIQFNTRHCVVLFAQSSDSVVRRVSANILDGMN